MTMIDAIEKNATTAKRVGLLLLISGVLAIVAPFAAGVSLALLVGAVLAAAGIAKLVLAVQAGLFGEGLLMALLGVLSLVAGGFTMAQPLSALAVLTLFLAGYFIASGLLQFIGALGARGTPGWGWLLFSGLVSIVLGAMIWRQFPLSGVWAVGTLVGIQLVLTGWTLVAVGSAIKKASGSAASQI